MLERDQTVIKLERCVRGMSCKELDYSVVVCLFWFGFILRKWVSNRNLNSVSIYISKQCSRV